MPRFALLAALLAAAVGGTSIQAQPVDTTNTADADTTTLAPSAADTTTGAAADSGKTVADSTVRAWADLVATDSLVAYSLVVDTAATGPGSAAYRRTQAKEAAQTAAAEWLALIGAGAFEESWAAADSTLRAGISREDWADQGIRARSRLDTLRARRLVRAQYRDSTAQLGGGHPVVVLRYASEYAKGRAREAVITTKRDTAWAVVGYRVVSARGDSLQVRPDTTRPDTTQQDPTRRASTP
ncbi:MAG: DUF4019 domain-containing protein [Salinibacter sp.]